MGVSFLLDTNVLSELLKPRVDPGVVRRFSRDGNDCVIASVVWHELLCGALRAPSVGRGEMFVMGDNRDNSIDSRYWGFVPDRKLKGGAFLVWMNFGNLGRIGAFR